MRTKFENRYAEEDFCNEDTIMNNVNILILSSSGLESINKRNKMKYLSSLTTESFVEVEVWFV